jgi:hypothetical protein
MDGLCLLIMDTRRKKICPCERTYYICVKLSYLMKRGFILRMNKSTHSTRLEKYRGEWIINLYAIFNPFFSPTLASYPPCPTIFYLLYQTYNRKIWFQQQQVHHSSNLIQKLNVQSVV